MTDLTRSVTGGVDTHKDFHVAVALDDVGRLLGTEQFPATMQGYRALLGWLREMGTVAAVGVEGTGSFGAGLTRFLTSKKISVVEVDRPNRQRRHRHGKSDPADAESAARAVLAEDATAVPKAADGPVEAIRLLRVARRTAIKARSQAANQLQSVIDNSPEVLRAQFRGLTEGKRIAKAAGLRHRGVVTPLGAAKLTLSTLAKRWLALTGEIAMLDSHVAELVALVAPSTLGVKGVGKETLSALLVATGDNPERLRSERSFAALCGVCPVDASSGRHQRHRLSRGGNRDANRALHLIVLNRLTWDPRTQEYLERRVADGKSKKEAIRCLKRYVARELYHHICSDLRPLSSNYSGLEQECPRAA